VKDDSRAWLSLTAVGLSRPERRELSERIVSVLTSAGLSLVSVNQAEDLDLAGFFLRGEALFVESDAV
jgi:hypothetical protein